MTKHVIFDALNNSSESIEDILATVSKLAGDGVKHRYAPDRIEGIYAGFDTTTLSKPSLGRAMLGWTPKKKSFVDGMLGSLTSLYIEPHSWALLYFPHLYPTFLFVISSPPSLSGVV